METFIDKSARTIDKSHHRLFYHLPPTAISLRSTDLYYAVRALFDPAGYREKFVSALRQATENPNCFLTSSGRSALLLILFALKRNSNRSKVILPAYTCPTVAQAVVSAGLQPLFCDIDPHTLDMDRTFLRELLDEQVLAIIPTHLYGLAQDVSDLVEVSRKLGILIIEDAAQAFGATIHGQMVGKVGDFGFFSLGRGKCIPAGHGGVIIASDRFVPALGDTIQEMIPVGVKRDLASLFRFVAYALATTPLGWWFIVRSPMNPAEAGMNINTLPPINFDNFSSTQAGIALSILARLDRINATRRKNAQRLMAILCDYEFVHFPEIASDSEPVFLRLPIILDNKQAADRLYHMLSKVGVGVSRSYFRTLPALFNYKHTAEARGFAGADHLADCLLTLPTHSYLRADDFMRIQNVFESIER